MHPQTLKSLTNARDFMRHAYGTGIRLSDISARANLSPHHFLKVHKEAFRETPREFLTRLRIERAKTLLARGEHNVTETCFEVGFSSLGSFSALFTRHVGISPSGYRRYVRSSFALPPKARSLFVPLCFYSMMQARQIEESQFSRSPSVVPTLSFEHNRNANEAPGESHDPAP